MVEFLVALVAILLVFGVVQYAMSALAVSLPPMLGEVAGILVAVVVTFVLYAGYYRVRHTSA